MKTHEVPMKTEAAAEFDVTLPFQAEAFTVAGDVSVIEAIHKAAEGRTTLQPVHNAIKAETPATRPVRASQETLPTYQPMTVRTKVRDWMSDSQWRKVDRELGTSIVLERQEQRLATRILVARIAAGVEKPPVWGKHKVALKLAEQALQV